MTQSARSQACSCLRFFTYQYGVKAAALDFNNAALTLRLLLTMSLALSYLYTTMITWDS